MHVQLSFTEKCFAAGFLGIAVGLPCVLCWVSPLILLKLLLHRMRAPCTNTRDGASQHPIVPSSKSAAPVLSAASRLWRTGGGRMGGCRWGKGKHKDDEWERPRCAQTQAGVAIRWISKRRRGDREAFSSPSVSLSRKCAALMCFHG